MKIPIPRGIKDIAPEEYRKYLWLLDSFREVCNIFGYKIMEPATIEYFSTLSKKSGPDIAREIYEFKDKAGRHIGLRFDLTVGLTRYVVSNPQIPKPIRLAAYSIQWRYDEPQYGRYRSFYAWDIEIYGGEELYSAIETISFIIEFFRRISLENYKILVSDRRLVEKIIREIHEDADSENVMRVLDKWGKYEEDQIIRMLVDKGKMPIEKAELLVNTLFKKKIKKERIYELGFYELVELYDTIHSTFKNKKIEIDPSIVRGLDYYDGIIFEVRSTINDRLGSIVGGGNYATLVKLFGGKFNAFGAAGGVERTLLALEAEGRDINLENGLDLAIIVTSNDLMKEAYKIAEKLRRNNLRVLTPLKFVNVNKQLKSILKHNPRYMLFIGEKEIKTGLYTLKDTLSREERKMKLDEIIKFISKN